MNHNYNRHDATSDHSPTPIDSQFHGTFTMSEMVARLLKKGVHQSEVARQVGVHRQSVSQWATSLDEKDRAGLKQAGRAGRKPRLSAEELIKIEPKGSDCTFVKVNSRTIGGKMPKTLAHRHP